MRAFLILALHASPPTPTGNDIGDDGAKAFAEALKVNNTLTQLKVSCMFPLLPIRKGWRSGLGGEGARKHASGGWVGVCLYGALGP